jgi:hypothetical protein
LCSLVAFVGVLDRLTESSEQANDMVENFMHGVFVA